TLFRIPGLGLYFTNAAASRDMPLLMGTALFFALILMVMNLLVDLVYTILDPRIRTQGKALGGRKSWQQPKAQPTSARPPLPCPGRPLPRSRPRDRGGTPGTGSPGTSWPWAAS